MKSLTPPYSYGGGGRKHSGRGGTGGGAGGRGGSRPCSKRKASELSSSLGPGLPALPNGGQGISGVARYTLQQLIITTEVLVPSTSFSGVGSRGRGRRLHSSHHNARHMLPMLRPMNASGEQRNDGASSSNQSGTPLRDPSAEFRLRMKPLTQPRKYGAVPAPVGDGSSPWDHSQLLHRRRSRIQKAKRFHKHRRAEFARLVMNSCRKLRATHRPSPPDLANILLCKLPSTLKTKYYRILQDLFQELRQREVHPVLMKPLGTYEKYYVPGVERVPWVGKERRALSRAMASFPPTVRTVMSHALRPLETLTLVDVNDGGGLVSSGEGVELSILITRWRAASRAGRTHLRSSWFSNSVSAIREAAIATNLSPSRRHAVMHAFNNLLASKLQEVLIRSVESVLKWLGSEEEPWVGPRLKLYLVLENDNITLQPNESELFSAFMDLFKELDKCVQLYRGTWEEPQPPKIPKWRQKAATNGASEGSGEAAPLLRPLEPKRETLVVTLSEPQWEGFRTSLSNSIKQRFKDAAEFISQIMSEWSTVLSGEVKQEVNDFLSQDAELHEYAGKISHYSKYIEQASHVPTSGTLHVFRLEYKFLRQSLLSVSGMFVSVLRNQLIAQHRDTVQGLNTQFETIHTRIQETPVSTDQLFKLMEYVEEVRRITIHRLAEEVAEMVVRLKVILDVVHLTDDDLATTAAVIVWPAKLKPVIERAVESLEDYKQEFEETLLERAGEVNHTLERIQQFVTELEELSDVAHVSKYIREVKKLEGRLEGISTLVTWVNQEEALFKFPVSSFPLLAELKDCLVPYEELFTLVMKWRKYEKHWMDGDFTSLDPDFIDVETEELARELFRLRKAFKTKFKQQALDGDPRKARMNLDDPNPDNLPGPLRVCALAMQQIKDFKEHLPLVAVLCNKGLRARHWENLNKAAGFDITPNAGTSLRKVVKMELGGLLKEFEVVSCGASREYSLELSLANMRHAWQTTHLVKAPHPEVEVDILAGLEDARILVEDHLITTHTIKNSPFVGPFVDDVKKWAAVLKKVQEALTIWMKVQTVWVEMTPIFSTPDLPLQLPDENLVFLEVHEKWMTVMEETVQAEHLLAVVTNVNVLANVTECLNNIDILQKAVHTYLDNKRRVFPRLYFLSNEELTSLLCEKDVNLLEKHLRKCFDGIHSLHLDDQQSIYAISSIEGEVVLLGKKVPTQHARDSIEHWLLEFQGAVTDTLKGKTRSGVEKWTRRGGGGMDVDSLLPSWPLQVTLAVRHIFWTAEVQQAIGGGTQALQECLTRVEAEVRVIMVALRKTNLDSSRPTVSTPHTPVTPTTPPSSSRRTNSRRSSRVSVASTLPACPTRHSLSTLMLVAVHSREIIKELIKRGVASDEAFTWLAHLRYYMTDGEVEARMLYCPLPWGWEYIGAEGRLVVTPLTTRAHHALVTAYNSHLGGAPEGPAGTGKTETVKDLARSLSMNCLVFNCSDDLDYISMGKFFTGVAADGSWACFDEFNTLDVGVLSVAAQQILRVVSARREGSHNFTMEGSRPLPLNHRGFIVVTMNPKYRGRVALPDNLKLLLRPVSMMVADYHSIAEVSLLSCGFLHARALASRIVDVMSACRNMLHPHYHYDFGMRAVKTVLMATARLRITQIEWSETEVVLRALREVNQPKLVAEDTKRFEDILGDYFLELPSTPRPPNATLSQYIEKICAKEGLKITKDMMAKTLQLYETLRERHGAMVVGPPCSAKSTIIRILANALSQMESDRPIRLEILNPKTMNQAQLIGCLHPGTREWSDGIVSQFIREAHHRRSWLVFDGPTDASWVESFNTALDDSRKLCLPSGETVPIPPDMVMIFEVLDLSQASPATVSRCGMVYVGNETISWHVIMHFWLHHNAKIPEEDKSKTTKPAASKANGKPGAPGSKVSNAGLKGAVTKGPTPGGRPSVVGPKGVGPGAKGANAAGNGDLPWWDEYGVLLRDLANWLIPPALQFLRDNCRHLLPVNQISLIRPVFPLTATMVDDVLHDESVSQKERGKLGPIWTTAAFLFSLTWSLAGALTKESKEVFNTFYRRLVMGYNKNYPAPDSIEQIGCPYPAEGSVFDVVFDAKQRSFWRPWTDIIKHTEIPETTKIATLLVPIIECTRLEYLIGLCGRSLGKVLVLGEGQSGRRVTMKHYFRNLKSSENETVILPITPAAVAQDIKSVVLGYTVERETGGFGAKGKRRLAIFVDDLHLAAHDPHNARPVHEVLREAMQRKVWIDNDGITKKPLEDIVWFCGASLSQGGKRKEGEGKAGKEDGDGEGRGAGSIIEPRCQAEFMTIAAPSIADETIAKIFTTQLNVFLRAGGFVPDVFTVVAGIVSGTMEILQHVRKILPPTPSNAHYTFNLSTAAKVIHSVSFMRKENMETKRHFVRFWVHEIYREFCDRLMAAEEVTGIYDIIIKTIKANFRDKIHVIFDKICNDDGSRINQNYTYIYLTITLTSLGSHKVTELLSKKKYTLLFNQNLTGAVKKNHTLKDWNGILSSLLCLNWSQLSNSVEPVVPLNETIVNIIDRGIKSWVLRYLVKEKPWFNNDGRRAYQEKQSVLGLLLFILYTHDMWFGPENKFVAYADGATLFTSIPSPECRFGVAESSTRDLAKITTWCKSWTMKLNHKIFQGVVLINAMLSWVLTAADSTDCPVPAVRLVVSVALAIEATEWFLFQILNGKGSSQSELQGRWDRSYEGDNDFPGECPTTAQLLFGFGNVLAFRDEGDWRLDWVVVYHRFLLFFGGIKVTEACMERVCWGIMGNSDIRPTERRYEELNDASLIQQNINVFIQEYNDNNSAPLKLVTFRYVVDHVSRACRALCRKGGHLLLVGVGGSGRRSLTRLAAHICGHKLISPEVDDTNDYTDIRLALKEAVLTAGVEECATVILLGDTTLHHPPVLHLLNTLILTGDIPNVLPPEDLSYLMDRLRLFAEDRGSNDGDLWKELIQRVADLVHVVITTSPCTSLTQILSQYPAFTTRLTMDYYKPWPQEALVKVGEHYLNEVPLRRSVKDSVITAATTIHQKARKVNEEIINSGIWCPSVTPASYLQLLEEFRGLFTTRQANTSNLKKKYLSGLDKLSFAASQISVMQDLLASLGPQIDEAARDVSRMMALIEEESLEVEDRRKLVQVEEEEAGVHAANAQALKEECQAELNQALPALYEAIEALNTLKPADITVVKSMKNPPNAIKLVMAAVCVMLEVKPEKVKSNSVKVTLDYWGPSKRLLGDLTFLQQLREYDKDNIAEGVMDKINREYVKLPEFDPVAVAKASSAAEGLCKWVRAMAAYDHINGIVAPKRARLAMAEEQLASRMAEVEAKRGELRELEDKLENLQRRFSISCREKEKLENEQKLCSLKLDRAKKLISGLGGEKERWEAAAQTASEDLLRLPGDTLMAGASLAYLAPYQPEIRDRLRDEWCSAMKESELEVTEPFSLVSSLTPALHIRAWGLEGLPTDGFSLQNATIIKHTVKWPLLVDPDELGTRWIQQHEAANGLEVVREQDMNVPSPKDPALTVLEASIFHCVPNAIPLLLLDLSADPPSILQNIISRTTVEEGGVRVYRVGSFMVHFKPGFRLYLATRQPRPHLSLETAASLTVVNFTITIHGLHDNLRQILVTKERPELEDERQKLVATTSSHQRALQDTEERILQTLSSAQGDILESEEAIFILQETKQMSDEIKRKQEQCVEMEEALLLCCQQYEKVSRPAANLYMTLTSLSTLSTMYQYSLSWYISLYTSVIANTGKSSVLDRRLSLLQEALVVQVHSSVVMGLASSHRLIFTFLITLHALRVSGKLKDQEELMLQKVAANSTSNAPLPPTSLHLDLVNAWPALYHLQMLDVFRGLSDSLENDEEMWLNFLKVSTPEISILPQQWQHLELVPWLILVAILRPDKVTWCVKLIIEEVLSEEFSSPPPADLNRLIKSPVLIKTGARTPPIARPPDPLLFVTSPGVDALEEVMLLASKNPEVPVKNVSLGQGQSSVAEEAVRLGVKEGGWIVLENLHHALGWLPFLANLINTIYAGVNTSSRSASGALNPNFRLILTTEPVEEFPVSLLRAVEKVYVDAPGDAHLALKEVNLALVRQAQSLYFDEEDFEADDESATYRLLHGLTIFHTIVSERGRHGHMAWASTPSFTMADLSLAMNVVTCSISDGHMVDLELLQYLVSRVFYGGRVLSIEDQLVISSILKEIIAISFKISEKEEEENKENSDPPGKDRSPTDKPTSDGEDSDETGLSRLFPETIDRLDDLQEFVLRVTGLDRPQVFGLPNGVQRVEEGERGRHFLNALAVVAGSQIRHRAKDKSMLTELKVLKKLLPRPIAGEDELFQCEDQEMADVLKREVQRYNSIISVITDTTRAAIQTVLFFTVQHPPRQMSGKSNELTEPDQAGEMVKQATDPDKEKAEIVMDPSGEDKEMEADSDTPLSEAEVEGPPGGNDIVLWPSIISEQMYEYWLKRRVSTVKHCDERLFSTHSKQQTRKDGMCLLFYVQKSEFSLLSSTGFCDWKHSHERLRNHEQSARHIKATVAFNRRLKVIGRVDIELTQQIEHLEQYWRLVLKQVVSVIHFIAERGIAFRGDNELVGLPRNGNFLGILELIAQYDDFLAQHIKTEANRGKGHTNYLSSTILEEVISIMGEQLLREIFSKVKKSKYYSMSLDSTPYAAHVDQLTHALRYMEKDSLVERFVTFMTNKGHGAEDMFNALMEFLNTHDLALGKCRGHSYDSASAMSGRYNGLQAKVREKNNLASWIPCTAHSLNLVGKNAVECCSSAVHFFDFLEKLADATRALMHNYEQIKELLKHIVDVIEEKRSVRCEAEGLLKQVNQLETGIYTTLWNDILQRTDATNKTLQNAKLDLNTAVASLTSLKEYIASKHDSFHTYEKEGELLSQSGSAYKAINFGRSAAMLSSDELCNSAEQLIRSYPDDLDITFKEELCQFVTFANIFTDEEPTDISTELFLYRLVLDKGATSGMIKAQIKCLALEALINSGKLSEENIVTARDLLEEAEEEFLAKQGSADLETEGITAEGDVEAEIRCIAAEENLIRVAAQKFDMANAQVLILNFAEEVPDEFLDHFEMVALMMEWPEDKCSLLVQIELFGKGGSTYLSLSQDQRKEYQEMAQFNIQEFLSNPSVQELSEANVTKAQCLSILMACSGHATSGMNKAQIKCLALKVLINSVKLSDENFVATSELLEEAEEEFLAKQEPVDPKISSLLLGNEVGGAPFMPCPIVTEKPLRYSPMTEREYYLYLVPCGVTTRSMKKKVTTRKEEEIERAINIEDLFPKEEDSLDSMQEEKSRVSPSEKERQSSGQEDQEPMDLEEMNLEDLFSEKEDSHDDTQEENSRRFQLNGRFDNPIQIYMSSQGTCRYDGGGEELTSSLRLGNTPLSWINLCAHPAQENLQHFLNDLHARVNFFKNWLENGCPTYFWLGAFQFLPAFFTTVLRQAARGSLRPLHHFSWTFHLTNMPCPQQSHLLPAVTLESESSVSASASKSEEGTGGEDETDATEKSSEGEVEGEEAFKKDVDGLNQSPFTSTEEDEYGKPKLPLNMEESKQKWHRLGHEGLLVSSLWLVGASWNSETNELDECTSQELIEKLPLLSMVPTAATEGGSYTSRGLTSKSTTSRSHPSTVVAEEDEAMESDSLPTERLMTKFTDEALSHIKDASLDLHLSEDLAITTRSDGLITTRSNWYECPVYEGAPGGTLRAPVLYVTLPAGPKGAHHWIQRRVAIYLKIEQVKHFDEEINNVLETHEIMNSNEQYYIEELDSQAEYSIQVSIELDQYELYISESSGASGNLSADKVLEMMSRMNIKNLSNSAKQIYLHGYLRGYALKEVKHLTISDRNYHLAIEMLKEEFLDVNYIIDETFKNILSAAPSAEYDQEFSSVKVYLHEIKSYLHEWKAYNIDLLEVGSSGHNFVSHIVFNKLPIPVKRELVHKLDTNYPNISDILSNYNEIIKTLSKTVSNRKKTFNKTTSKPSLSSSFKPKENKVGVSTILNYKFANKVTKLTCKLCAAEGHTLGKCVNFNHYNDKVARLRKLSLCTRCAGSGHEDNECYGKQKKLRFECLLCRKREHITPLCPSLNKAELTTKTNFLPSVTWTKMLGGTCLVVNNRVAPVGNVFNFLDEVESRAVMDSLVNKKTLNVKTKSVVNLVMDPLKSYFNPLEHILEDSEVNNGLEHLFSLESLGIKKCEQELVSFDKEQIDRFREGISLDNGFYHVELPWYTDKIESVPSNHFVSLEVLDRTLEYLGKKGLIDKYQEVFDKQLEDGIIEEIKTILDDGYKVLELILGLDNNIRSVKLKQSNGAIEYHSICNLYPMELSVTHAIRDRPSRDNSMEIEVETASINKPESIHAEQGERSVRLKRKGTCRYDGGGEELTSSLRLGNTPLSWINLCAHPAQENLQHFLNDLHARVNFFKNWLENGCPTYFWLGAFQFLPAFFTTVLRQAARGSLRPLHHFSWTFHLTNMPCPQQSHLLPAVTLESESSVSASASKSEEGTGGEDETDATEKSSEGEVEGEEAFKKDVDGLNQSTFTSTEEDEYGKPKLPLNMEESKQKWHRLGHEGLLVSSLWLVGASWNSETNELDECTSQELIEKLPLLSMVPTAATEGGSYTSRGLTSKSTTSRSHPSTVVAEEDEAMESDSLLTERLMTKFTDEALSHIKDASLDLHLSEDLAITTRSDGLITTRSNWYECPVYEGAPGSTLRAPVLYVTLPAGPKGAHHWIQRRVAIYLSRN
ncbi:uncharacterized protein [Palaemon carinicauda]|uniref:uncharacterized protein n=1 Tax=Palaemon carinicauda TaxID=392227 RepID=UPI0035B5E12F